MDPIERNANLKKIIGNNDVVVWNDAHFNYCDGLPAFSILFNDLKAIFKENSSVLEERIKNKTLKTRKPKVDMGRTFNNVPADEKQLSSNFDPKLIKGNTELYQHIIEDVHSKMKTKFEPSGSTRVKKIKKKVYQDDHGIRLPTPEIRKDASYDSEDEALRREEQKEKAYTNHIDNLVQQVEDELDQSQSKLR